MNNWKKQSLIILSVGVIILFGLCHLLNVNVSIPSSDIEFSPGQITNKETPEFNDKKPKNIIVFIADGMGFGHLSLALQTQQLDSIPSVWQEFDVKGWHDARAIYGPLTDSEASATAIATGTSTNFGHIGIDTKGEPLKNIFELASDMQYNTGIVTDSYIWDGTPAGFLTHIRNEDDARGILNQIASSQIDLIFGELEDIGQGNIPEKDETIEILKKRFSLLEKSLDFPNYNGSLKPVAAIFNEDEIQDLTSSPNLMQMTDTALKYLSTEDKPFLLLVESEEMDSASHQNNSKRVLNGLRSIQETLALVLNFAKTRGETLVLFTADHETGGLAAVADFDSYPKLQMSWSTKDHTAAVVPLFADGPGAEYFASVSRNWEIGYRLKEMIISNEKLNE